MSKLISTYLDSDDGLHPYKDEHYYEWWYFDARFTNGYSCVAIWHWRNAALTPHLPSIQIYIYTPEGKRHSGLRVINPVDCQAKTDICDVAMKDSYVRQQGNIYTLSMLNKGVGCELTFEPQVRGWKHNDGLTYNTPDIKQGWIIACPRAKVKGKLYLNGTTIPVEGSGYHDHNWGNALLSDCCNGWYWGRLSDTKYTAIFYKIYETDNSENRMLYLANNQDTLLDTDKYEFTVEEEASHEELLSPYAKKIKLNVVQDDIKLEYQVNAIKVVEAMRLSKDPSVRADYGRFLADYEGSISVGSSIDHVHGQGIYERFIFR